MKRILSLVLVLLFAACSLTGCTKYVSHYYTIGHVCSNTSESARTSFMEFEGSEVFKLKCKNGETAEIQYSGKLESGGLTAYYDCGGGKTELFSIRSGEEISAYSERLSAKTVYVIIETSEKCKNGDFRFEIRYE